MFFALYCDEEFCLLGQGRTQRAGSPEGSAFYFNDFFLESDHPWISFDRMRALSWVEAQEDAEILSIIRALPLAAEWDCDPFLDFGRDFLDVQKNFGENFRKILLAVCDRGRDATKLKKVPDLCGKYFYAYSLPDRGELGEQISGWGLSPELLFELDDRTARLNSVALAGTYSEKLAHRSSLEREHEEVLDFFRDLTARESLKLEIFPRETLVYGPIRHLKSRVELTSLGNRLGPRHYNEWVRRLHPTPALGVSPRSPENLERLRALRRNLPPHFAAPFGFAHNGICKMIAMIRGYFIRGDTIERPIGVGVTKASEFESEKAEIEIKRDAMEIMWTMLT